MSFWGVLGPWRVFRGPGWYSNVQFAPSACRGSDAPVLRSNDLGLRFVRRLA